MKKYDIETTSRVEQEPNDRTVDTHWNTGNKS